MTKSLKSLVFASAAVVALAAPSFALAQSAAGIIVMDADVAISKSTAWTSAMNLIPVTYKAQIDALNARKAAINATLQPQITAFENARKLPNANQVTLRTQYQALQAKTQAADAELQQMALPIERARQYALEQMRNHVDSAIGAVVRKRGATLALPIQATYAHAPSMDASDDLVAQFNTEVPSVSIVPAANWQPGQQQAAPAATPAPAAGSGR